MQRKNAWLGEWGSQIICDGMADETKSDYNRLNRDSYLSIHKLLEDSRLVIDDLEFQIISPNWNLNSAGIDQHEVEKFYFILASAWPAKKLEFNDSAVHEHSFVTWSDAYVSQGLCLRADFASCPKM